MVTPYSLIDSTFNQIHYWSEPEQNPMQRMFLTRLSEIGCVAVETFSLICKTIELMTLVGKQLIILSSKPAGIFSYPKFHDSFFPPFFLLSDIKFGAEEMCRLIVGLASTIFIGIVFSPETNFKIHLKLRLIRDNLAEKTKKERAIKLLLEKQSAEIIKARKERFDTLKTLENATQETENKMKIVKNQLTKLLLNPSL